MFSITRGGMVGHLGRLYWFNGSDLTPDDYRNTLISKGSNRFGSLWWMPVDFSPENYALLHHYLGFRRLPRSFFASSIASDHPCPAPTLPL